MSAELFRGRYLYTASVPRGDRGVGASRPPMGNSASLNSSVLRLIFGNKQTMLNAKTIGFLLIIVSNHDLHPYHEEIGRYKVCRYKRRITPDEGKTKSPESLESELPLTRNDAN